MRNLPINLCGCQSLHMVEIRMYFSGGGMLNWRLFSRSRPAFSSFRLLWRFVRRPLLWLPFSRCDLLEFALLAVRGIDVPDFLPCEYSKAKG